MKKNLEAIKFVKFLIVGLLNTAITYITYVVLRFFNIDIVVSNMIGYILGLINSFVWNKTWVFKHKGNVLKEATLFLFCFCICYSIQLLVLMYMNEKGINEYLTQFIAMVVYTVLNFILNRVITFKTK